MITIKEIAEKAGVSAGTVDRVLHDRGRVSPENIEKIRRIAEENGYVPNQLARRLQGSRLLRFGALMPELGTEYGYWQQIANGLEEAKRELETLNAEIVYSFFDRKDPESFVRAGEVLFSSDIDAYITAPILADGMRELASRHPDVPYAFIDSSLPDLSPIFDFSQDPIAAGYTAARLMRLPGDDLSSVFTIQMHKGAFNGEMRAAAFTDRMRPCMQVENFYADRWEEMEERLMKASQSGLVGIFVVDDQASMIARKLDANGAAGHFRIVGFDLSEENRRCLSDGLIYAIIGQRPGMQGHDAVMALYNHLMHVSSPRERLSVPVDIYIRENIPESPHWL